MNRFEMFLNAEGIPGDRKVLDTIIQFPHLRDELHFINNGMAAISLYERSANVPRTETRVHVRAKSGVVIDGPMVFTGIQSASFFQAFRREKDSGDFIPSVLKVPRNPGQAELECMVWNEVGAAAMANDLSLVPVEYVSLGGYHSVLTSKDKSDMTHVRAGVLMPQYACTLANMPVPVDETYGLHVFDRIFAALEFLHEHAWMHGDVKPSNIFIDAVGRSWLGDYGSSQPFDKVVSQYTGGTPAYQCDEARTQLLSGGSPIWFDKIGLAISILCRLGLVDVRTVTDPWPLQAIKTAADRVLSGKLKDVIISTL